MITLVPHFIAMSCKAIEGLSANELPRSGSTSKSLLLEADRLNEISSPSKEARMTSKKNNHQKHKN